MKKFILTLAACFLCSQSIYAIPSNLGESLREYQAIISADDLLSAVIPEDEFIIEIERITKNLNATTVYYEITTRLPSSSNHLSGATEEANYLAGFKHSHNKKTYIAKLLLTPNPQIGPPLITVVSIQPFSIQSTFLSEDVGLTD